MASHEKRERTEVRYLNHMLRMYSTYDVDACTKVFSIYDVEALIDIWCRSKQEHVHRLV